MVLLSGGFVTTQANAQASDPFLGQLAYVGFGFAPRDWADCNGQLLSISQHTALFALLGTMYGGDGRTTFALPDMRGRVPIHVGQGTGLPSFTQGQGGGDDTATLNINQIPPHAHSASTSVTMNLKARAHSGVGGTAAPEGAVLANSGREDIYSSSAPDVDMAVGAVTGTADAATTVNPTGGGQPFSIMQPYLVVRCIIALQGVFPSRN
ncbi:MAG: phage tail protein [Chloroflexi bacterium]|nr:phage tail protein [Chloroflexota bacterium]